MYKYLSFPFSYLTLCSGRRSQCGAHLLPRRECCQHCKPWRTGVPGRSCGVQKKPDWTALTEDMREQKTTLQHCGTQWKGHTNETAVLMERQLNGTICGERLWVCRCKHHTWLRFERNLKLHPKEYKEKFNLQHNSQQCHPLTKVLQTLLPFHLTLYYHVYHKQKRDRPHLVRDR